MRQRSSEVQGKLDALRPKSYLHLINGIFNLNAKSRLPFQMSEV